MEKLNSEIITEETQENVEETYKSGSMQYMDSREVAEMVEKNHKDLMRDIRRYCKQIEDINNNEKPQRKITLSEFFMEDSYFDIQGQKRPCYLVTRKGCEFIAHKLTGLKGTKFTVTYINRFHEMENVIAKNELSNLTKLVQQQAQVIDKIMMKLDSKEIASDVVRNDMTSNNPYANSTTIELEERKKELYSLTSKVAGLCGISQTKVLHYMYRTLERKLGVTLDAYKSVYMSETGKNDVCMVEVIAADSRMYETATEMNREVIEQKQIYG